MRLEWEGPNGALAATDPTTVMATFRQIRVPARLAVLIEGESLFNDGTAIVVFAIAIAARKTDIGATDALVSIGEIVVLSVIIGSVGGFLGSRVIPTMDDHPIGLAISLTVAYGTYLAADAFDESGVLAPLTAGIVIGTCGRPSG